MEHALHISINMKLEQLFESDNDYVTPAED